MHPISSACPACQNTATHLLTPFAADTPRPCQLSVHECAECGLAWQYPLARSATDSVDYFQAEYRKQSSSSYFDPQRRAAIAALQAEVLAGWLPAGSSVLDIGAGDGAFVREAAARGLVATGVDPAAPIDVAMPQGARLLRGSSDDLDPELRFDAVTTFDVIEHVENPDALIEACLARLRPGGLLLVETGNYESADRIAGGDHWWCFQADHRWYFAPSNLARLLRQHGLTKIGLWSRMLRPGAAVDGAYRGPSRRQLIGEVARHPWQIGQLARQHMELRKAAHAWPQWSGLPIFLLVATTAGRLPVGLKPI